MQRGRPVALGVLTVLTVGFVAFLLYWSLRVLEEPPVVVDRAPRDPGALFPEHFDDETVLDEVEGVVASPAPAARNHEISGFVFDGEELAGGGDVAIGDEIAPIGPSGEFRFPAIERPRFATVEFRLPGAAPIVFPWTVTDGHEDSDGPISELDPVTQERDYDLVDQAWPSPARLRWTLTRVDARGAGEASSAFSIDPEYSFVEDWGLGGRVRIRGSSDLPDGARIYSTLEFDGIRIASSFRGGAVSGGRWEDLVPCDAARHLYAGDYALFASFNLRLENASVIDSWPREVFERIDAVATELVTERSVRIGEPREARDEDLAEQSYYCPMISDISAAYVDLHSRLAEVRRYGIGWDPVILEATNAARSTWFRDPIIGSDGRLDERVWRRFLDDELRPQLVAALESHRARPAKYIEAQQRIDGSLDSLIRLSYLYSTTRVYGFLGLETHPKDEYESGSEAVGEVSVLERRLEDNLEQLQRFCRLVRDERPQF